MNKEFVTSIIVIDGDEMKDYPVKNAWAARRMLIWTRNGDLLKIEGLGMLKVIKVLDDDYGDFVELCITCKMLRVNPYLPVPVIEISDSQRIEGILREEYDKVWKDAYYD